MSSSSNRTLDYIAAGGLLVGAVFGLSGTLVASPTLQASLWAIDSVAGTALWAAALALISAPRQLPWWTRGLGGGAACLFAITAGRIYAGEALVPTSSPLPFFAYPFLVATLLGWAWVLLRGQS